MSAVELVARCKACVGQVDAEKLAQRSSAAAWLLSCGFECACCHLKSVRCFPFDCLRLLNLFTGLRLGAGRFDVLLCRQSCSVG